MKIAKLTRLIIACIVLLVILQLVISARLSLIGNNIAELEEERESLILENRILEQKIASASALSTIRARALAQGFTEDAEVRFLDETFYVVQK